MINSIPLAKTKSIVVSLLFYAPILGLTLTTLMYDNKILSNLLWISALIHLFFTVISNMNTEELLQDCGIIDIILAAGEKFFKTRYLIETCFFLIAAFSLTWHSRYIAGVLFLDLCIYRLLYLRIVKVLDEKHTY